MDSLRLLDQLQRITCRAVYMQYPRTTADNQSCRILGNKQWTEQHVVLGCGMRGVWPYRLKGIVCRRPQHVIPHLFITMISAFSVCYIVDELRSPVILRQILA